jgi:preprotein translocase SecE subunit
VWLEVSKVVWPSGGDVVHNSAIVIVMLVAVLLAALAVDATSSWGVFELIAR